MCVCVCVCVSLLLDTEKGETVLEKVRTGILTKTV